MGVRPAFRPAGSDPWRISAFVVLGAVLAGGSLLALYPLRSSFTIEFAVDPPRRVASGFHAVEQTPDGLTFAWTRESFALVFRNLDRRAPWAVTVHLAASRSDGTQPELITSVDGTVIGRTKLPAGGFVDHTVTVAPRSADERATTIAFAVSPAFTPGPHDPRVLGVQVDWIRAETGMRWSRFPGPLWPAVALGAAAGGLVGAAVASTLAAALMLLILAVGSALVFAQGLGPYVPFATQPALVGAICAAIGSMIALPRGRPAAGLVVAMTFTAAALQLLVLFHPDMPIGDALFHAHRFQDVLGGRYYFTSVTPGDYRFPYAIALYVLAAPFSRFTRSALENAALLRIVVVTCSAFAAALLYRVVQRWRDDEVAAAGAVAAYHLLPLSFGVIATGNLTNVFGQAMAMLVLAIGGQISTSGKLSGSRRYQSAAPGEFSTGRDLTPLTAAVVTGLAALAFLSHTSTFAVLGLQLLMLALVLTMSRAAERRRAGRHLLAATGVAVGVAVVIYYAHFMDVYREAFARISAETGRATAAAGGRTPLTRLVEVPSWMRVYYGYPLLALSGIGVLAAARTPRRSTVAGTALVTWFAACLVFLVVGIVSPVDMRHALAALPAIAVLAGLGFGWLWQGRLPLKALAAALAIWAGGIAIIHVVDVLE